MATKIKTINSKANIGIGRNSNIVSILVKNGSAFYEVIGVSNYTVAKRLDEMSQFTFSFMAINPTLRSYIIEQAEIFFMVGNVLFLKGRIQKVTYLSNYDAIVTGWGLEAVLFDKQFVKNDDIRVTYDTPTNTNTIAKEILSINADGSSPWDMDPIDSGTIATFGNLQMRFESAYKLNSLSYLAKVIRQNWWISHSINPYETDYFNISTRGTTPGFTFKYTGAGANCNLSSKETDVSGIINYIHYLGYGDGINQLKTLCYNMSPTYSTLASDITSSSATITLADASSFASSGTIRIMEEQVTYSGKSGNDLTGCSRGQNSTTAREHKKNCFVEKHIAWTTREDLINNSETNSSIKDYGIQEHTETDRTFRDLATMEILASNYLLDHIDAYTIISLQANNPANVLASVDLGDTVTAQDGTTGLSGDYKVVTMSIYGGYGMFYLNIELSNKSLALIEQLQKIAKLSDQEGTYMLGATNVYQLGFAENCDYTHAFNLRFYLPDDIVAVNKVLLNFKMENFRSYSSAVDVTNGSSVIINSGNVGSSASVAGSGWTNHGVYAVGSNDTEMFVIHIEGSVPPDSLAPFWKARVYDGTNYYPDSNGVPCSQQQGFTDTEASHSHSFSDSGTTLADGSHSHTSGTYVASNHRHTISSDLAHDHTGNTGYNQPGVSGSSGTEASHDHGFSVSGTTGNDGSHWHETDIHFNAVIIVPGNMTGKTLTLQIKHGLSDTIDLVTNTEFTGYSRHTHDMANDIFVDNTSLTNKQLTIKVGDEGSEAEIASSPVTYTSAGFNIDITNDIPSTAGWKNIKFTPLTDYILRIDAAAFAKVFIESR